MNTRNLVFAALIAVAGQSMAATYTYAGTFSGLNEVPANTSPGIGSTLVNIDTTAGTMHIVSSFSGMIGNTSASHIHLGNGPGTNGGVATKTPSFTGFPLGVTGGTFDQTYDMTLASNWNAPYITANGGTAASALAAFVTGLNAGKGYHNIHSTTFAGGELRANLTAVPEPGSLVALGLGAIVLIRRRRA